MRGRHVRPKTWTRRAAAAATAMALTATLIPLTSSAGVVESGGPEIIPPDAECVQVDDFEGLNVWTCVERIDPSPTTSSTVPATTTTTQASTSTTAPTTTSTLPSTTSSTVAASTTTSTLPPSTTSTTGGGSSTIDLSADLLISSDEMRVGQTINANGHAILIDGADITWQNVTVNDAERIMWHGECGVTNFDGVTINNSGTENVLGAYALHWHMCGDSTRGSVINDTHVVNSNFRAFVPHASHGITITNSSATNTTGEAVWWDRPGTNDECRFNKFCTADNTNDLVIDNLLVDGVNRPEGVRGFRMSGVVLGAGSGNVIRNSHVTGVDGSKDCSAYHWPEFASSNVGGSVWVFENNTGDSACHGIFVWQNESGTVHTIDGFTGGGIEHGAYRNVYHYQNVNVPYTKVVAVSWSMADSHAGHVSIHNGNAAGDVTFTNVTIDSITVDDAADEDPVRFIVNGTNITCGDIVWVSSHPQTQVVIDGSICEKG